MTDKERIKICNFLSRNGNECLLKDNMYDKRCTLQSKDLNHICSFIGKHIKKCTFRTPLNKCSIKRVFGSDITDCDGEKNCRLIRRK